MCASVTGARERPCRGRGGLHRGREAELAAILARYEFDYVLGGVHFLGDWMIDDADFRHRYRERSVAEVYREYYRRVRQSVRTGLFDLLSHLDLPKKFGDRPEKEIDDAVDETLDAVRESGIAVEISSAGLRKPVGEIYPSRAILRAMNRRGIPIALSSDAHDPAEVGFAYGRLIAAAREAGYRRLVTFDHRVRAFADLG